MVIGFRVSNVGNTTEVVNFITSKVLMLRKDVLEALEDETFLYPCVGLSTEATTGHTFTVTLVEATGVVYRNIAGQKLEIPSKKNGEVTYVPLKVSDFIILQDTSLQKELQRFVDLGLLSVQEISEEEYYLLLEDGNYLLLEDGSFIIISY